VVEGFVIEQGLKFIMTVDYNKFREVLRRGKERRQFKKQQKADTTAVQTQTTFIDTPPDVAGGATPLSNTDSTTETNKTAADDRKSIPALDKASTDEY
jgi:translocation and assembly module TamB